MNGLGAVIRSAMDCEKVHGQQRLSLATLIAGRALAYILPIPTSPVADLSEHFRTTQQAYVIQMIDAINEVEILNIDRVIHLVCDLYTLRYRMVYDAAHPAIQTLTEALMDSDSFEVARQYIDPLQDPRIAHAVALGVARVCEHIKTHTKV